MISQGLDMSEKNKNSFASTASVGLLFEMLSVDPFYWHFKGNKLLQDFHDRYSKVGKCYNDK